MAEQDAAFDCSIGDKKQCHDLLSLMDNANEVQSDYENILYQLHHIVRRYDKTPLEKEKWENEVQRTLEDFEFYLSVLRSKFEYIRSEFNMRSNNARS